METFAPDSFSHMRQLFTDWLRGARTREILRLLELLEAELAQRGHTFRWRVEPGAEEGR